MAARRCGRGASHYRSGRGQPWRRRWRQRAERAWAGAQQWAPRRNAKNSVAGPAEAGADMAFKKHRPFCAWARVGLKAPSARAFCASSTVPGVALADAAGVGSSPTTPETPAVLGNVNALVNSVRTGRPSRAHGDNQVRARIAGPGPMRWRRPARATPGRRSHRPWGFRDGGGSAGERDGQRRVGRAAWA